MSKAYYQFSPDNLNLKTGTGIREPNVIRIPKVIGMALYGPYVDLPAGRYEAVIRFDPDTPCHGEALMDVCAAVGTEKLTGQSITAKQIRVAGMSARLEFSCARPLHGVEVRLSGDGKFSAGITAVEISGELSRFLSGIHRA